MREIIINGTYVSDDKATYTYKFPLGSQPTFKKGDKIALASLSMYYSWPSITAANGNNTFTYTWIDASVNTITVPDGFYTIADLNSYLQYKLIANNHYATTSTGSYVYFFNFSANSVKYAIQLDVSPVPTSATATTNGWTVASGASWTWPASSTLPQLTIPSSNSIKDIIGFTPGTYPPTGSTSSSSVYSHTSDYTPQVTPVSSVIVTCSLLDNKYSIPNNLLYSFSPNVAYGSQIAVNPNTQTFVDMLPVTTPEFSVTFLDQNFKKLPIKDTNVVILLAIDDSNYVTQGPAGTGTQRPAASAY